MAEITPIVPYRHGSEPLRDCFPANTLFVDDEGKGKKYALKKGMLNGITEYAWLLDDDVEGSAARSYERLEVSGDMVIMPLVMTSGSGNLIERMQQVEYAAIQTLTMMSAEKGRPVMCSGANLIVRRDRWLESWEDLHEEIPSGDDMFLLESFKRRGLKIECAMLPLSVAPKPDLRSLLRQRMRWAGKAPHYTDRDIRRCGAMVVAINLLSVVCPPLWLVKLAFESSILGYGRKHYPQIMPKCMPLTTVLLSLLYPWYMLICLIGGLLRRSW